MDAIIIKAERLNCKNVVGVDMQEPHACENDSMIDMVLNQGNRKRCPGGLTCTFRNNVIPALVTYFPGVVITGSMLKTWFKKMDQLDAWDRTVAIPEYFIDERGGRFDHHFLECVNSTSHI